MKKYTWLLILLAGWIQVGYGQDCQNVVLESVAYSPTKLYSNGVPSSAFNNQYFGYDRTIIGDVNDDGHEDMIIISHPQDQSTRMWLAFLGAQGEMLAIKQVNKITNGVIETSVQKMFDFYRADGSQQYTGAMDIGRLAAVGDVNGDGVPDILIATPHHQIANNNTKGAYGVGFFNTNGDIINTTTVQAVDVYNQATSQNHCERGFDEWHRMGISVDVVGDINGDGIKDIVIGATMNGYPTTSAWNNSRNTQGRVYTILLHTDGRPKQDGVYAIASPTTTFPTPCESQPRYEEVFEEFGNTVAGIGDIDGNGVPDIAVGSPDTNPEGQNQFVDNGKGKIHIYLLDNNGRPIAAPTVIANGVNGLNIPDFSHFGSGITSIGDVNCDNTPEIIVTTSNVSGLPSKLYVLQVDNQANLVHHQQLNTSATTTFPSGLSSFSYAGLLEIDKGKDWPKLVNGVAVQDGINDILLSGGNNADYVWRLSLQRTCDCTTDSLNCTSSDTLSLTFPAYELKEVLNTSAQTLSDNWLLSKHIPFKVSGTDYSAASTPSYMNGKEGIWRGESSFAYVTDRKQTAGIDVSEDGTFDLKLFNWMYLGELDCPEWRKVETVSEYHPQSSDVERYNILELYSSFHIGYNDQLVLAAAANSKQYEFGFEGFEEFDNVSANGNLLFSNLQGTRTIKVPYWFTLQTGRNRRIWSSPELTYLYTQYNFTQLHLVGKQIDIHYPDKFRTTTTVEDIALDGADKSLIKFSLNEAAPFEGFWTGKAGILLDKVITTDFTGSSPHIADGIAHTGQKSLQVPQEVRFEQPYLLLIPNKKYVISAWVRVDESTNKPLRVASYEGLTQLSVELGDGTQLAFQPTGQIIEGWQRIEGSFTVPQEGMGSWAIRLFNNNAHSVYFDDIRLFPSLGNMESFVYDTSTYRLEAKLDANNYATLYYYDAEGRLYLVKQETAKGIQTLQTVTTHTKTN